MYNNQNMNYFNMNKLHPENMKVLVLTINTRVIIYLHNLTIYKFF